MSRFAPSPTGFLHIGHARIALLNYILTFQKNHTLRLRVDDTDIQRSQPHYIKCIEEDLEWLGIKYRYTYKQSERDYSPEINMLKQGGYIYPCYETIDELEAQRKKQASLKQPPRYQQCAQDTSRPPHWRFRLTHQIERWNDGVMGEQEQNAAEYSDPVVIKEDGTILYNLASVIDDYRDNSEYILRGQDHISNTVAQIQILRALNPKRNINWMHMPLMTEADGLKLSKRRSAENSIQFLRYQGYDSLALIHALLDIGKATPMILHKSLDDIAQSFQFKYNKAPGVWDHQNCYRWQLKINQSKSVDEGLQWLKLNGWSGATAQQWQLLSDILGNRDDVIYWRTVLTDNQFYVPARHEYEKKIRNTAAEKCIYDINELSILLPEYSKGDIGTTIHRALTGLVKGPSIQDLVVVLTSDILRFRLFCNIER